MGFSLYLILRFRSRVFNFGFRSRAFGFLFLGSVFSLNAWCLPDLTDSRLDSQLYSALCADFMTG
jgi:hypothetical protein